MNVSFSILFLGWWLLGQWQMSRGGLHPKPYISIHPRGMIALGGNVSIRCWTESEKHVEYYLTKEVNSYTTTPSAKVADPCHVIFPIVSASISDGGSYWCLYHNESNDMEWSPQSDIVYINLTDPILPKPSIEVIPTNEIAPELNVTILCRGPENGLIFALHKANMQVAFQTTKPETDTAEFLFVMLTLEDAGNYTCQYHQRGSPFVWSEPSEPVEVVFRGSAMAILPASIAAGIALLALLLLLLAYLLQRKKRKGSITKKEKQPMDKASEPDVEEMPDEVSYAILNPQSQKTKQTPDSLDQRSETCVYSSVVKN
ncbi:T-cell-interacting, activating receptor on myeloid cells protein 1 [Anolis carolinensis]|uniref:Immunoglobulin-like beta-sandwich domain-containing protein n=1 Tax=Anolis carolinensis TaxID=28377 RepID=H9GNS4_ANOCA|nr:PREDICTED: T-cell-interacting, activating receptor on myeloid cells protein 1 [Anolis carolinensis]|eukprot:XP_008116685.1 PREDICTED: T-cell-interacting, activating receptor on myeloid cells protein 1 [Anolis carolinensis]